MTEPVIRVQNLSKHFQYWSDRPTSLKTVLVDMLKGKFNTGKKEYLSALKEVTFDIFPGEFIGIMGRNGAGKSTLLKLICGIYTPSSGTIEVRAKIAPLIELGAGFAPDLSGHENIFLNAAILGLGRKATQELIPQILDFSELGEMIYMPVKNYSSGMLVRLAFAIAAHIPAPIILVDEILGVGDVGFQEKCVAKIKSLHAAGHTIVLITHAPGSVKELCQRCIVIDHHEKVYDGPVDEGINYYIKAVHQREH